MGVFVWALCLLALGWFAGCRFMIWAFRHRIRRRRVARAQASIFYARRIAADARRSAKRG